MAGSAGSTDGSGTAARFNCPWGITTDGVNLYVTDQNNYEIREIVISSGQVSTFAGKAGTAGHADGTGSAATFGNELWGIATDGSYLYVCDASNSRVRRAALASAAVTTLSSTGTWAANPSTAASIPCTGGIATDGTNLFLASQSKDTILKLVISTGSCTQFAGSAGVSGSADGSSSSARFSEPIALTMDSTSLYVADLGNLTIRQVVLSSGTVTTLAGTATAMGWTDDTGASARFAYPSGITTDGTNLYVCDGNTIRIIQ